MLARFVRIEVHIVFRRLELSTLTQFGAAGTNQLYVAALANGASAGFFAFTPSSVVELAMLPAFAISVSEAVPVKALTQSAASDLFLLSREKARVIFLNAVRPAIACGVLSVPCHLLPLRTAIWPP